MAYDKDNDENIKTVAVIAEDKPGAEQIVIGFYRYGGPKGKIKLGITRRGTRRDGTMGTGPLGRLTRADAEALKDFFSTFEVDAEFEAAASAASKA